MITEDKKCLDTSIMLPQGYMQGLFYQNNTHFYNFGLDENNSSTDIPTLKSVQILDDVDMCLSEANSFVLPNVEGEQINCCDGIYKLGKKSFENIKNATLIFTSKNNVQIDLDCFDKDAEIEFILPKKHKLFVVSHFCEYTEDNKSDKVKNWLLVANPNIYKDLRKSSDLYMLSEIDETNIDGHIKVNKELQYNINTNEIEEKFSQNQSKTSYTM